MAELHEECGVFGAYARQPGNLAGMAYYALYALQHRDRRAAAL